MLLLVLISMMSMELINNRLETIASSNLTKVRLASDMLHSARERSILLHRMVLLDDPFERDELALELDVHGSEFGDKRMLLKKMHLSEEEESILDNQGKLTSIAIPLQRKVVDLVAEDELEEAKAALLEEAMPAQDRVLEELKNLINLQKKYADEVTLASKITYANSRTIMIGLGVLGILIGVLISRIFIRKISTTEKNLQTEKEKAEITFRSIGDAVITTNSSGIVEYINNKAEQLVGIYSENAVGKMVNEVFPAYDSENNKPVADHIHQYLSGNYGSNISSYVDLESFDKSAYKISVVISPILTGDEKIKGLVITFNDVTKSVELMQRIEYQAKVDALTGLPNRREFEQKVRQLLSLYERNTSHAFCIIDLDRFKIVNDTCGHQAGDELLKQLSQRMRESMRKGDLLARIGGDEFAVFFSNIDSKNALKQADDLLKLISNYRFLWEEKTFTIGASIGLVDASPEISDYEYLYHSADRACYIAKNEGRNRVHMITPDNNELNRKKDETDWIHRLNKALDEGDFYLFGQQIVPLSPRAEGRQHVEILLRMLSDDRKVIAPMAFIPVAERYGLMQEVDRFVLQKTCAFINDNPLDYAIYAVNLSGQTLSSISAMEKLVEIVKGSNIPVGRLCLEVTETVAIANLENAKLFMQTMQELGCYTALDDFGSGLSSFSYLKNLPLDYIKIDGIFVSEMLNDKASAIMVDAIHSVGKKLGLMTIAEYVENEETVKMLRKIGVDFAQGYHFSKPELCVPPVYSQS